MKKVFIYCRVSSNGQISGDGFPHQIEACQRFIDSKGWHTARIFQETQSGSNEWGDRKLLSEATSLCGGVIGVNTIVIDRSGRLAHDMIVSELFLRECRNKNIEVFVTDSGEELVNATSDPTRILIRKILEALVQWEKGIAVRKMVAGRRAKAERTGVKCGGLPLDRYGDRGGVAQQNLERRIIGTILYWRKNGKNFREISNELTARRIKIPHPDFVRGRGGPKRAPFYWTQDLVRGLYNDWVNTKTIMPFVGEQL